jgi:hypothetical protein
MMTRHAMRRCQQRGITMDMINMVLDEADAEAQVGDNGQLSDSV